MKLIVDAANRARFLLQRQLQLQVMQWVPPALQLQLFKSLVRSILSYSSQVWAVDYLNLLKPIRARRNVCYPDNDLEAVQNNFVRFLFGVSKYSSVWCAIHDACLPLLRVYLLAERH
jgi:hypothetical protein